MNDENRIDELVDHLFRHQAGQMMAALTHMFGIENLDLAEDVVQDALMQALKQWPYRGIPDNPRAWLIQVARNKALDLLRRKSTLKRVELQLQKQLEEYRPDFPESDPNCAFRDEQLAMIFACCHPELPPESRVALTLKAVSGFSVPEIARAFLAEEPTIAQRIVRAKRRIRDAGIKLHIPEPEEIPTRLESVLQVLYLLFNEGYTAHTGENLVREELCEEAIRLGELIASHPVSRLPKIHALLALFYLQAARLPARVDSDGNLLLLEAQDRSAWDKSLIARGLMHLAECANGTELTTFHIQAGIAAVHATSSSFAQTDWAYLLELYDQLAELGQSAVVSLNRAIALSMVEGPESGLRSLDVIESEPAMKGYYLYPAVRADLLRRLGRTAEAADCYRLALARPCAAPERRFLQTRLNSLIEA